MVGPWVVTLTRAADITGGAPVLPRKGVVVVIGVSTFAVSREIRTPISPIPPVPSPPRSSPTRIEPPSPVWSTRKSSMCTTAAVPIDPRTAHSTAGSLGSAVQGAPSGAMSSAPRSSRLS